MLALAGGFVMEPDEVFSFALLPELFMRTMTPEAYPKYELSVLFSRIAFPYLLFVSLVALLSGILNSQGRFALAAGAPVILNIVLITTLLFFVDMAETPGHALVWGVFAAGAAQFFALAWGCAQRGYCQKSDGPDGHLK